MSLLRQWQLLETVLIPLWTAHPSGARLMVWNLGALDDALAIALAYMHWRPADAAGELTVFHTGPPPPRQPVEWPICELRGVPRDPWMEPVGGRRSRWTPRTDVLERVVLGPPPGPVDLVVGPTGDLTARAEPTAAAPCETARPGGHLLLSGPGPAPATATAIKGWEPVDPGGHLLRRSRSSAPVTPALPSGGAEGPGPTLARVHERARLSESYTNLARALAHRFAGRGERVEDLEQVAFVALVKAADRYEPQADRPFGPYATACIAGELKRHFRDKMWAVRIPRSIQESYMAIRSARDDLGQTLGRSPTIAEIGQYLRTSEEDVLAVMDAAANCWGTSLDAAVADGSDPSALLPTADSRLERTLDRESLKDSIRELSPTERLVVRRVFFDEQTQRQVAEELGVSQMQISRLMHRTLAKMRTSFQAA